MTIGIAAVGPNAGSAILQALSAVEKIGSGAIGGFVSFVAIHDGRVLRAQTQIGGATAILAQDLPPSLLKARIAALMSSGPNRPEPLAQFTPADAEVGLVTGHRLPNTLTPDGMALNEQVLELIRSGVSPENAVANIVAKHPTIDAGVIAVTTDGDIAFADTDYVARFFDAGRALLCSDLDPFTKAAVVHNAIQPWRGLAMMTAQTALNVMDPPDRFDRTIKLQAGQMVRKGECNGIREINGAFEICVENEAFLRGRHDLGLGPRVPIERNGQTIGFAVYEPYLSIRNGTLMTIDGATQFDLPIRVTERVY